MNIYDAVITKICCLDLYDERLLAALAIAYLVHFSAMAAHHVKQSKLTKRLTDWSFVALVASGLMLGVIYGLKYLL